MRLTDNDILTVIEDLGTASATQIINQCMERWPDQDRTPSRIRAMIPSLVRFRFLGYVDVGGIRYYHIYGTTPNITAKATYRARVSEFLTAQAPRRYTSQEIADNLGMTRDQVARVLEDAGPKIKRTPAKPFQPKHYYAEVV